MSPFSTEALDPMIDETAEKLADVMTDFNRDLHAHHGSTWGIASGHIELSMPSHTFELTLTPNHDGVESEHCRIIVQATLKSPHPSTGHASSPSSDADSIDQPVPVLRKSDPSPDSASLSRKRRTPDQEGADEHGNDARKRVCIDHHEHTTPQITKEHINNLVATLREDIQRNTSKSVNHVQSLLQQLKRKTSQDPMRESTETSLAPATPGASSTIDQDDAKSSIPEIVHRQTKTLSSQIKWVEECRRVAADIHDKREDTWRTTSAGFHEEQRKNRESFQNQVMYESNMQRQTLSQILNEVKAIGLYAQNMKWETPSTHLAYPPPPNTLPPNYPPQSAYSVSKPPPPPSSTDRQNGASSRQPYRPAPPK